MGQRLLAARWWQLLDHRHLRPRARPHLHRSLRLQAAVEDLSAKLEAAGVEVLVDDRGERAGVMFADLDLIGIPHRLVLSDRGLDRGTIEYKKRHETEASDVPIDQVVALMRGS